MRRGTLIVTWFVAVFAGLTLPGVAHAQSIGLCTQANQHWPLPYQDTAFGPLAQYTEITITPAGTLRGRVGFHSPLTGEFVPQTDWMEVHEIGWKQGFVTEIDTTTSEWTVGHTSLHTGFGPFVWATQFRPRSAPTEARWGVWSLITERFYPAASGWRQGIPGTCPPLK